MAEVEVSDHFLDSDFGRKQIEPRADALEISVIGNVTVAFKGRNIRIKSRKSLAVLACIALNESRQETRERLVGLFWSETEEDKARASLRQTLRELRRSFAEAGYPGLQTEKLAIELDPGSFTVDLLDVVREAEARRVHPLLLQAPRLADRLLDHLDDIDPSFRIWVLAKRQTINDRLLRMLEDGLRDDAVDAKTRRQLAEALANLDPTHEEACRSLMKSRAEEGDVAAALRIYKTLWDLLDEEYDMEPSAKTQQLVAEIKQGVFEPAQALAPPSAPTASPEAASPAIFGEARVAQLRAAPRPEVAAALAKIALLVSKFQINGVNPDQVHLVHGFRHHLIASLVRFREWSVVDYGAPASGDLQRSANLARYTIDATAYYAGHSANVILTLRQNETNAFVWSETFELKLENWFEAQQRIIRRITTSLNVQLSAERLMRLAEEPDVSLAVYDRWLRGQTMITKFHHSDWDRASQIFADVIREAPNFSPGYSSLVAWNNGIHIAQPGIFRDPGRARNNVELARKAVQLDPLDSRAQLCLGWSYAMSKLYAPAAIHMDLARQLNENDPWMMISSGLFYAFSANFERANELVDQAFERTLSPSLSQWAYLVSIRFLAGDYESAIEAADRGQDLIRTLRGWKAAALFHLGHHNEARAEAERFLAGIRSFWFGSMPPTDETIARWFLHLYPISEAKDWDRLRAGIVGAGVPVSGIEHHGW